MPLDASRMLGKNIMNFGFNLLPEGQLHVNFDDDIVKGTCVTHQGEIVNERVKAIIVNNNK